MTYRGGSLWCGELQVAAAIGDLLKVVQHLLLRDQARFIYLLLGDP